MKNIHLQKTDTPSRLFIHNAFNDLRLDIKNVLHDNNQHIYITSDEEIKDCWVFNTLTNQVYFLQGFYGRQIVKKIILTTDQDLIADGVQSIDDEFLEWFVQNPSCEEVEIEKVLVTNSGLGYREYAVLDSNFKVIEINTKMPQISYCLGKVTILDSYEYVANYKIIIPKEPKRETLEEAAKIKFPHKILVKVDITDKKRKAFIEGAKWQAERSYSEEEVRTAILTSFLLGVDRGNYSKELEDKLIEQFKKKKI